MADTRADAELVAAWLRGERDGLASIYDRYADALYAYALSRLHDAAAAADVVQTVFERAATRLGQLREPERLRAWLYAVTRRLVWDHARRRRPIADDEELETMAGSEDDPVDAASRRELAALVWAAAEGLTDRDREVLALHLRHGLDGAELADVIGVAPSHAYVLLNRLKERMGKAVGALLVARHGRADCAALAEVLSGWDGHFTLDVRSRVVRHVEACDECRRRRTLLVSPQMLSAGALALPLRAPASLRDAIVHGGRAPADPSPRHVWRADGFPRQVGRHVRRGIALGAVAAMVALVAVLAGTLAVAQRGGGERDAVAVLGVAVSTTGASAPSPLSSSLASPAPVTSPVAASATSTTAGAGTTTGLSPTTVLAVGPPDGTQPSAVAPATSAPTPGGSSPASSDASQPPIAPPDTTPATTAAVAPPPPPAPPTPPAPPARLAVLDPTVDLGATATARTVRVRNDGGQPAAWSARSSSAAARANPASGTLAPGEQVSVSIALDRRPLAEGSYTFVVTFVADRGATGGTVVGAALVERAPTITRIERSPTTLRTSTACGRTLTTLSVEATDESGIARVEAVWSSDSRLAQRTPLAGGSPTYSARIGSFTAAGTATITVQVRDTRGNVAQATTTVSVVAC